MSIRSVNDLIAECAETGLLSQIQFQELTSTLGAEFPQPKALAQELLRRQWLTAYQIEQLLQRQRSKLVLEPYIILQVLGQGGMGVVFLARHRHLKRLAALKVLSPEKAPNPDMVRRFYREMDAIGKLSHPNVVQVYDAGQSGGTHFFAMEYVEGDTLSALVQRSGPLPIAQACNYVRQAALGLQHAHDKGLVHRDIKPSNLILAAKEDLVKLADLGIARLVPATPGQDVGTRLTVLGTVVGTLDYLAPEQALDAHEADNRADIYSLGCTLYYLLASVPPFPGGGLADKILKHRNTEAMSLEVVRPGLPKELGDLVRKMMAKKPEDRLQTAAAIADALAPFCAGAASPVYFTGPASQAETVQHQATVLYNEGVKAAASPKAKSRAIGPREKAESPAPAPAWWTNKWIWAGALGAGAVMVLLVVSLTILLTVVPRLFVAGPAPPPPPVVPDPEPPPPPVVEPPPPVIIPKDPPPKDLPVPAPGFSWLDHLKPDDLPEEYQKPGQPLGLVAVLASVSENAAVRALGFSRDGKTLATSHEGEVRLWDFTKAQPLKPRTLKTPGVVHSLAFAREDSTLFIADAGAPMSGIREWNLDKPAAELKRTAAITALTFDGRDLFAVAEKDELHELLLTDLADPSRTRKLEVPAGLLALFPDGKKLAAACDKTIHYLPTQGGLAFPFSEHREHAAAIRCLAIDANVTPKIASGDEEGNVCVWNPTKDPTGKTGVVKRKVTPKQTDPVLSLAFSPDGKWVAAGTQNKRLSVWLDGLKKGQKSHDWIMPGPVHSLAYAPDGRHLAVGNENGTIYILRLSIVKQLGG